MEVGVKRARSGARNFFQPRMITLNTSTDGDSRTAETGSAAIRLPRGVQGAASIALRTLAFPVVWSGQRGEVDYIAPNAVEFTNPLDTGCSRPGAFVYRWNPEYNYQPGYSGGPRTATRAATFQRTGLFHLPWVERFRSNTNAATCAFYNTTEVDGGKLVWHPDTDVVIHNCAAIDLTEISSPEDLCTAVAAAMNASSIISADAYMDVQLNAEFPRFGNLYISNINLPYPPPNTATSCSMYQTRTDLPLTGDTGLGVLGYHVPPPDLADNTYQRIYPWPWNAIFGGAPNDARPGNRGGYSNVVHSIAPLRPRGYPAWTYLDHYVYNGQIDNPYIDDAWVSFQKNGFAPKRMGSASYYKKGMSAFWSITTNTSGNQSDPLRDPSLQRNRVNGNDLALFTPLRYYATWDAEAQRITIAARWGYTRPAGFPDPLLVMDNAKDVCLYAWQRACSPATPVTNGMVYNFSPAPYLTNKFAPSPCLLPGTATTRARWNADVTMESGPKIGRVPVLAENPDPSAGVGPRRLFPYDMTGFHYVGWSPILPTDLTSASDGKWIGDAPSAAEVTTQVRSPLEVQTMPFWQPPTGTATAARTIITGRSLVETSGRCTWRTSDYTDFQTGGAYQASAWNRLSLKPMFSAVGEVGRVMLPRDWISSQASAYDFAGNNGSSFAINLMGGGFGRIRGGDGTALPPVVAADANGYREFLAGEPHNHWRVCALAGSAGEAATWTLAPAATTKSAATATTNAWQALGWRTSVGTRTADIYRHRSDAPDIYTTFLPPVADFTPDAIYEAAGTADEAPDFNLTGVFVTCDLVNDSLSSEGRTNVLSHIPVPTAAYNSTFAFQALDHVFMRLQTGDFSLLRVSLESDTGAPLSLGTAAWQASFLLRYENEDAEEPNAGGF